MSRIFYVFSLLWGFLLFGQHTVTGIVYGSQQQPLEGAHIHLSDQSVNALKDGTFQFRNVPQGKHKVFVTYVGYLRKDTLVVVTQAQDLVLRLQKDPVVLQEVAVKGNPISNKGLVVEAKVKTVELQRFRQLLLRAPWLIHFWIKAFCAVVKAGRGGGGMRSLSVRMITL